MVNTIKYPILLTLVSLFLAGAGCGDPQDIPPTIINNDPEYYARFEVNGTSVVFEAGLDNILHETSNSLDANGVVHYMSVFYEDSCTQACTELTFELTDILANDSNSGSLEGLLTGNYLYEVDVPVEDLLILIATLDIEPSVNTNFVWTLNGSPQFTSDSLAINLQNGEFYEFCVEEISDFGCQYTQCVSTVAQENQEPCYTQIEINCDSLYCYLTAIPSGTPPFYYSWSNGDSTQQAKMDFFPGDSSLFYSVTVTDATFCESVVSQTITPNAGANSGCSVDLDFSIQLLPEMPTTQYSAVGLIFKDGSDQVYRSDLQLQTNTSEFRILEITELANTPLGSTGRKAKVQFNCNLVSSNGNIVQLRNGEAVIAFSREK